MRKHSWLFLLIFIPAATAVAVLATRQRPDLALAAGAGGLLLQWLLSRSSDQDAEIADSSYFFGFLLTLVFLAAGLARLGDSGATGPTGVFGFLKDLGAGLALTILGLLIRQVRTLANAARPVATPSDSLSEAQRDLAQAMRVLIRALDARPQEVAARELEDARAHAREATEGLERNVVLAAERIESSLHRLEETTTTVTAGLMRASSGLGDALTTNAERIQIEVASALSVLETQRKQIEQSVLDARATSEETQRQLGEQMRAHVDALTSLSASSTAFFELADRVKNEVVALPNPAERLVGLWDGVKALESNLNSSISGATEQLATMAKRSADLSNALVRLERSSNTAASAVEQCGAELGDSLRRELAQMNRVLDEYTRLFERNLSTMDAS
jgi:chromosome segregation ATPase